MYGIGAMFKKKYAGLIFSLISGTAYYIIILNFILKSTKTGGLFLGFMFLPAIIAGAALIIIKSVKRLEEEEKFKAINIFLYFHLLLIAVSIVFLIDIF